MEQGSQKISLPEIIIMILIVGSADLLDIISNFVIPLPVIGLFFLIFNFFVDTVVLLIIQFWFIIKGGIGFRKQVTALVGNLMEFIPGLDILPLRTLSLIIAIYLINHSAQKTMSDSY